MFENLTYFNWLVIAGLLGGFLGTLLAWLTNFVYKILTEEHRARSLEQFVDLYLAQNPLDRNGLSHVSMVRLEVDASKSD